MTVEALRSPQSTPFPVLGLLLLAAITLAVYGQVLGHDFTNLDDDAYVTENPPIHALSLETVRWAFTAVHSSNWHPLTWLSHALDWRLFGAWAGGHKAVNLLIHVLNTALLACWLFRVTGARRAALLAAGLFALHPLHVESVAWVAERKDVLSAFFALCTLCAYDAYVRRPGALRLSLALFLLALGLMAKPMLVTLPCVLLLLDFWPYQRVRAGLGRILGEKSLFLLPAAASIVLTLRAQEQALLPLESLPLAERFGNAAVAYVVYLWKTAVPWPLAVPYPLPAGGYATVAVLGALALLAFLTLGAVLLARRMPWLLVGWLWFIGTLVPVIGVVQVGSQAYADRYTYLPHIGLFIAAAWSMERACARWPRRAAAVWGASVAVLAGLALMTAAQVRHWRDSESLFLHAIAVTGPNSVAHNNLAKHYLGLGRVDEAAAHLERAVDIAPGNLEARNNLGAAYLQTGRVDEALRCFAELLPYWPEDPALRVNLAAALHQAGRNEEARAEARRALELDPAFAPAHRLLRALDAAP